MLNLGKDGGLYQPILLWWAGPRSASHSVRPHRDSGCQSPAVSLGHRLQKQPTGVAFTVGVMEPLEKEKEDNPSATANLLSKIFFCWLNPLFRAGYKRRLEEDDMYKVLPEDASERLGEELQW
ncbi:hypothetical protein XENORESO_014330 [Xenotaenia resolanae]|uniref:Uncharacterized protein n=2 Tax=Goodeidae TaxID=28758 RepID=A0ABV0VRE3_9TELE